MNAAALSATTSSAAGLTSSDEVAIPSQRQQRLGSLDVFRGATIAAMILVNDAGDWDKTYRPLLHAEWHGWTPTDLVFFPLRGRHRDPLRLRRACSSWMPNYVASLAWALAFVAVWWGLLAILYRRRIFLRV